MEGINCKESNDPNSDNNKRGYVRGGVAHVVISPRWSVK